MTLPTYAADGVTLSEGGKVVYTSAADAMSGTLCGIAC